MAENSNWPTYRIGPRDSIFAVGVASVNFAELETALQFVFGTAFDTGSEDATMLVSKMGAEATVILLRQKLPKTDWTDATKDLVEHFLKGFEVCKKTGTNCCILGWPG
jgi:hypothetical protein